MVKPDHRRAQQDREAAAPSAEIFPTERSIEISIAMLIVLLDPPQLRGNFRYTTRGQGRDRKAYIIFNTVNDKLLWLLDYGEYL